MEDVQEAPTTVSEETARPDTTAPSTSQPRIKAFLAPDDNAASAAQIQHNDEDYHPTIDHAKIHQARLEHHGKNTRLLSDAELETQRQEREAKISGVQTIKVRFRFPDQTQIETSYTREHTAQTLFETMAEVLRYPEEKYVLSYREGAKVVNIKRGEGKKLITGLGWTVSTLVYVTWALEGVDEKVKKEPTLKDE
jgi:tether containing UBX domain for GLUT4